MLIFIRAQASAFIGYCVDYASMVALTELCRIHYTVSIILGGFLGAIVNFCLNRRWTFYSKDAPYHASAKRQIWRFISMVILSVSLKSLGTYLVSTAARIDYKIGRLLVDSIVSLFVNFPLQKHWVFRKAAGRGTSELPQGKAGL